MVVLAVALSVWPLAPSGAAEEAAAAGEATEAQQESSPEDSVCGVDIVRYADSDPYALSIEVAQALVDTRGASSEWVVLASGESWAEAAAAGPLAASLDAPVLLVPPGGLQSSAARPDLVEFLESAGTRRVVIVGSPDVLPNHEPSVLFGLGMLPRNIERVHGDDAAGTSIAVAERIGAPAEFGELGSTVIIASDRSVADAVAVGPLAAAGPFPLLLTAPDALDQRISAYLAEHEVAHVVLVGGTAAIAPAVQEAIETADITVTRLAGADRSETARLAADLFEQHIAGDPECAGGPTRIGLALAQRPRQALTAGPLLARGCAALRFTEPERLPPNLHHELFLSQSRTGAAELHVFGGAAGLSDDALDVSKPPVQIAAWSLMADGSPAGPRAVLIVSYGHGQPRVYPQTAISVPRPGGDLKLPWLQWGPDGQYLAYRDPGSNSVAVLDTASGELIQTRGSDQVPELLDGRFPSWSPDGSRLVFSGIIDDAATLSETGDGLPAPAFTGELFLYDIPSGETTRLTHNNRHDGVDSWSADGSEVVYGSRVRTWALERNDGWTLSVVNVSSRETRVLWQGRLPAQGYGLSHSPDGNRILFAAIPDDGWQPYNSEIFVIDADGDNLQQLTPSNCESCFEPRFGNESVRPHWVDAPWWSPRGDKALYWVWVRADTGLEASLQIHEFATGKGRVLRSSRSGDLMGPGRRVGWSSNEELLHWFPRPCDVAGGDPQRPAQVTRIDVRTGSVQQVFEVPPRPFEDSVECPRSVSMSKDGQHFAARYTHAGLHVYSLQAQRWTTVIDTWSRVGGGDHGVVGGCVAYWADVGIRGKCNEILANGV